MTVEAHAIPLNTLLTCISDRTGIPIITIPSLNRPVTLSISQPVEQVFARILREENYALFHETDGTSQRISKVKILPSGNEDAVRLLNQSGSPSVYTPEQGDALTRQQRDRALPLPTGKRPDADPNASSVETLPGTATEETE